MRMRKRFVSPPPLFRGRCVVPILYLCAPCVSLLCPRVWSAASDMDINYKGHRQTERRRHRHFGALSEPTLTPYTAYCVCIIVGRKKFERNKNHHYDIVRLFRRKLYSIINLPRAAIKRKKRLGIVDNKEMHFTAVCPMRENVDIIRSTVFIEIWLYLQLSPISKFQMENYQIKIRSKYIPNQKQ